MTDDTQKYLELTIEDTVNVINTGGGGDEPSANEIALIEGTLTKADYPTVTNVNQCAFYGQLNLTEVNLPEATTLGQSAFGGCAMTSLSFPKVTSVGAECFAGCDNVKEIKQEDFPLLEEIGAEAFKGMNGLEKVDVSVPLIYGKAFANCSSLKTIVLRSKEMVLIDGEKWIDNTPIANGDGYFYVPDDQVENYKVYAEFLTYTSQLKPLSELPA